LKLCSDSVSENYIIGGQGRDGVDEGPHRLLLPEFSLLERIADMGWNISFDGHQTFQSLKLAPEDDPDIGKLKKPRFVSSVTRSVSEKISSSLNSGKFALTIGGDHSLAIGSYHQSKEHKFWANIAKVRSAG
jgi:arginase